MDPARPAAIADDHDGDHDGDHVDVLDSCPDDPEDVDGFQDDDGCPDPDVDHHHHVLDVADRCPDLPEGADAEDLDGCPG